MRVTTQGEYGLRCMINIGKNSKDGPVSIQKISDEEDLPRTYVEQLLLKLRRNRLISSVRGAKGGYLLARDPSEINMKDIIKALEGKVLEIVCDRRAKSRRTCKYEGRCSLNRVWKELSININGVLENITLEDLIEQELKKPPA